METDPEVLQTYRRALRVLRMVHELHKIGYQRIRIAPGMSPSGAYWRCAVTHAGNILKSHGARMRDFHQDTIHYGSGQKDAYFGWEDARHDTVQALAARFLERQPEIARAGLGRDWAYAGWYVEMLGAAERHGLPIAYYDYQQDEPGWLMTTSDSVGRIPMPPGGEADDLPRR